MLSHGATPASTPGRGQGTLSPLYPSTAWPAGQHRQGEASNAAQPPLLPTCPFQPSFLQRSKLCWGFHVAAGEGVLAKVGKGVTGMGKGKNNIPCYCKWVVWRATRGELASVRTQLKGPAGTSPFLISLKCSRTEPAPTAATPLQNKSLYIYI